MPTILDRNSVRELLERGDLRTLFIEQLGWDRGGEDIEAIARGRTFVLKAIAHKRGMVAYEYRATAEDTFPDHPTRQRIEKSVARSVREHIIVYLPHDTSAQYWQWVKREQGQPDRSRLHIFHAGQSGEALMQRLENLVITLEEEEDTTLVDVVGRVRAAFDVERVTRRFYDRFKTEHNAFLQFIERIESVADREWYASLMLNRMMFIYFIQKRGFLDGDPDYLRHRLERVQREQGKDRFLGFYRMFLLRLFHEGLGKPEANRAPELAELLGQVPYLNGGLFDVHDLERDNPDIEIPDEAFQRIFDFFDAYSWHLDDRPLHNDNEINPDVLGYIFEKYINQKQMGAYYTKEDITGYISRNTIIPHLFQRAEKECPIAFKPGGGVWRLLQDDPDRYFFDAVRHGITYDIHEKRQLAEKRELPSGIAKGLDDVAKRNDWNNPAESEYALPTETWREHVARRQHYEEVRAKLADGEIVSIDDLITYNLDVEKFAQDVIAASEGPELVRAFWKAINRISILDPTCGSGAFLFVALNILEPIYIACLEVMRGFLDDLERLEHKHHPETMRDFRKVLKRVEAHAGERYFILKSIIVGNLYGVDIMEEAVEICKLRMFLKLVAQLENYDQIEPLPDIDFNVRAGNTLVGFASLDEVKRALGSDMVKQLALPDIEERAEIADRAFRKFREMQTEHGMDALEFTGAKAELRQRLNDLRAELNRYLADDYGKGLTKPEAYMRWHESHQPFHWFVEFYGVMQGGGFDVIIGNPPYVEYSKVKKDYEIQHFSTEKCGNIFAFCTERSLSLLSHSGRFCFIVPLSIQTTGRMSSLQDLLMKSNRHIWLSSFDVYPCKLFEGAKQRLSILNMSAQTKGENFIWTTSYNRWSPEERKNLFSLISYSRSFIYSHLNTFPKIGNPLAASILNKLSHFSVEKFVSRPRPAPFYVHRIPYNYVKAMNFIPYFWNEVDGKKKSEDYKPYQIDSKCANEIVLSIINSNLFFFWWYLLFEGYHCGRHEIVSFPYGLSKMPAGVKSNLKSLSAELMEDLKSKSQRKTAQYRTTGRVIYDEFYPSLSKSIIDKIDRHIAKHYGLLPEEVDFLINYSIKYRIPKNLEEN